jgi:hypothetical protein
MGWFNYKSWMEKKNSRFNQILRILRKPSTNQNDHWESITVWRATDLRFYGSKQRGNIV